MLNPEHVSTLLQNLSTLNLSVVVIYKYQKIKKYILKGYISN